MEMVAELLRECPEVTQSLGQKWPTVVEEVKKPSSKWLKSKGPGFGHFQWQAGYGAFSVGASMVPAVAAYIARQKGHHRTTTFQDEFRSLLKHYGIDFEERSVWD
jgi:hypothetical protein